MLRHKRDIGVLCSRARHGGSLRLRGAAAFLGDHVPSSCCHSSFGSSRAGTSATYDEAERCTNTDDTFSHEKTRRFCLADVRRKTPCEGHIRLDESEERSSTDHKNIEAPHYEKKPASDLGERFAVMREDLGSDAVVVKSECIPLHTTRKRIGSSQCFKHSETTETVRRTKYWQEILKQAFREPDLGQSKERALED